MMMTYKPAFRRRPIAALHHRRGLPSNKIWPLSTSSSCIDNFLISMLASGYDLLGDMDLSFKCFFYLVKNQKGLGMKATKKRFEG